MCARRRGNKRETLGSDKTLKKKENKKGEEEFMCAVCTTSADQKKERVAERKQKVYVAGRFGNADQVYDS